MISAYISNIGKYNEGVLAVEPLRLPATTEEVQAVLSKIGVERGAGMRNPYRC